jgi:hypothetical protein
VIARHAVLAALHPPTRAALVAIAATVAVSVRLAVDAAAGRRRRNRGARGVTPSVDAPAIDPTSGARREPQHDVYDRLLIDLMWLR